MTYTTHRVRIDRWTKSQRGRASKRFIDSTEHRDLFNAPDRHPLVDRWISNQHTECLRIVRVERGVEETLLSWRRGEGWRGYGFVLHDEDIFDVRLGVRQVIVKWGTRREFNIRYLSPESVPQAVVDAMTPERRARFESWLTTKRSNPLALDSEGQGMFTSDELEWAREDDRELDYAFQPDWR